MAVEVAITFRIRRRWLLTAARWTAKVHKPTARRMARLTILEYRQKAATGGHPWRRIDLKDALS